MYDGDADGTNEPLPGTINSEIIPVRPANTTTPFRVPVREDQALARAGFVTAPSAQPGMEAVDGRETIRISEVLSNAGIAHRTGRRPRDREDLRHPRSHLSGSAQDPPSELPVLSSPG
ncbi:MULTISPECIES: hypothetical protein [unclassified Streptomyces]|uniref:hypothetical protein n=1 Tax=unclassified Streptomyces TaxID=2593676 RepID=UPI0007ED468A|nr:MULTISPECIES: hypothetical protein [unclassified Streptomyces]MCP3765542.1 hypothetical protein [Streptomyces sp. MAR25Y5]OBQ48113.1 hypothetical protein A4U61_23170 [Streptomyces sp. H-KF8]